MSRVNFLHWLDKNCSELDPDLRDYIAQGAEDIFTLPNKITGQVFSKDYRRPSYSKTVSRVAIPDQEIKGDTFVEKRDGSRLRKLQELVEECMADSEWRTLPEIRQAIGKGTEASISARLRDAEKSGRAIKQTKPRANGLWLYRLIPSNHD